MKSLVLAALVACGAPAARPAVSPTTPAPKAMPEMQMKQYFLVMLRRGPAWTPEKTPETKRLFEGHMANINAMEKAGKLILAGPIDAPETDRNAIAGIFIFDNIDRAGLDAMLAKDPAIEAGRLLPEVHAWYGPVGLTYTGKP